MIHSAARAAELVRDEAFACMSVKLRAIAPCLVRGLVLESVVSRHATGRCVAPLTDEFADESS
jgi:hypothetical protein